jgi:diguanylate cyclase (GGDEF)-like protein/PAS domain S-box-containing protein
VSRTRGDGKPGSGSGSRVWALYLVSGVLATFVFFLLPEIPQDILYILIGVSATVMALEGARWQPAGRQLPLYLFAGGLLMTVTGDVIYTFYEDVWIEDPFPSTADVFYVANYLFYAAALLLLVWHRTPGRDWGGITDAAIITTGAAVLSWIFLMKPYADDHTLPLLERLISISYPLLDLLLLAVAARLLIAPGARVPAFYFIGVSLLLYLISDVVYVVLALAGAYESGNPVDAGYMISYVLLGTAALHPSMPVLSEPGPRPETRLTWWRFALLTVASLATPGVLAVQAARGESIEAPVIVGGSVILFLLVLVRLAGFVRRHERAVTRERILREAGAVLVGALNRKDIYAAALKAAMDLMKDEPRPRVYIATGAGEDLLVVATAGDARVGIEGNRVRLNELPDSVYSALLARQPVRVRDTDAAILRRILDGDPGHGTFLICPLAGGEGPDGAILAASGSEFSEELKEAFQTLSSQVSLALETVILAEDLHRRRSEARMGTLVQNASDIIAVLEESGVVRYVSPAVERILGHMSEEMTGRSIFEFLHPRDVERVKSVFVEGMETPGVGPQVEFRMKRADGFWRYLEASVNNCMKNPDVRGFVLNCRDTTERRALESQLTHQAFHDPLTGLPNRALFVDRVEHALIRARRRESTVAVLFTDLDNFKVINDSLGHEAGDELLVAVAARIQDCLRPEDTVARFGGDEFTVLLEDVDGVEGATRVAGRMAQVLQAPFYVRAQEVFATTSIGIALNRSTEEEPGDLLRNADLAMYRAKDKGKDDFEVFEPGMNARALERLELENDLRRAIERGEFAVYYQPVVLPEDGRILGFEALVRWAHPERDLILPSKFVPLAEETGLIVPLGRWVLGEACRQAREWQRLRPYDRSGNPSLLMNVNLSVRQLRYPGLVEEVAEVLRETGLDPGVLVLEITESVAMEDVPSTVGVMRELKSLGIRLAIDDFGTGYTSLSYLKRFPVDYLKIDRSFTGELEKGAGDRVTLTAIIDIAHALSLKVLAEGVEDARQLARLRELGCDLAQGNYFSEPLPPEAASELLANDRNR